MSEERPLFHAIKKTAASKWDGTTHKWQSYLRHCYVSSKYVAVHWSVNTMLTYYLECNIEKGMKVQTVSSDEVGYTKSCTNSDPNKIKTWPKPKDWFQNLTQNLIFGKKISIIAKAENSMVTQFIKTCILRDKFATNPTGQPWTQPDFCNLTWLPISYLLKCCKNPLLLFARAPSKISFRLLSTASQ